MKNSPAITSIVITGGPGGGKTDGMPYLHEIFSARGYNVLVCPEGAREIIADTGKIPGQHISVLDFQHQVTQKQLQLEADYRSQAVHHYAQTQQSQIIFFDRGLMDTKGYLQEHEFEEIERTYNLPVRDILTPGKYYDAVVSLLTSAVGTDAYTSDKQRSESPEDAIIRHYATENVRKPFGIICIDNSTEFKGKMHRTADELIDRLSL